MADLGVLVYRVPRIMEYSGPLPAHTTKRRESKEKRERTGTKASPGRKKPTKLYGVSFEVDDSAKHDDLPLVERKSAGGPLSFHSFKFEGVFFGF